MPLQSRPQIREEHVVAVRDVPTEIALDERNSIRDRLQAAKILGSLMKIVWEDELYTIDLAELAPLAKPRIIYVREDENFFGNNAHQLERERAAREAEQEAEERHAAGLPVESVSPHEPSSSGSPPADHSADDQSTSAPATNPQQFEASPQSNSPPTNPTPTEKPKRRWNEDPPLEPWDEEDDEASPTAFGQPRGHPPP